MQEYCYFIDWDPISSQFAQATAVSEASEVSIIYDRI